MGRLDAIQVATRPKMSGRMMISGPSGSGKTWTGLSMATRLAADAGRPGEILWVDTEKESALTYADSFTFHHLPWRPPFDPDEFATTIANLGERFAVVGCDSFTHFWRGPGGTLSIADGKFGGWKTARPVQERVTEAILSMPCHMILCVRSKTEYLVTTSGGKQEVTKVGLAPVQDDDLVYEMNVAMDIDLEHRITVTKSRTAAVPVGRMYPAGMEGKAADDYAEWLAGGTPPAAKEQVDEIVAAFASVIDKDLRKVIKDEYVQTWGMPATLTADKAADAKAWVMARVDGNDDPAQAGDVDPTLATFGGDPPDSAPDDEGTEPAPDGADEASDPGEADTGPVPGKPDDVPSDPLSLDEIIDRVKAMTKVTMVAELASRGKSSKESWTKDTLGRLLTVEMARENGISITAAEVGTGPGSESEPVPDDDGTLGV